MTDSSSYAQISPAFFLKYNPLLTDVFIRLGPEKYTLIYRRGEAVTSVDMERYQQKKEFLGFWVTSDDVRVFFDTLTQEFDKMMKEPRGPMPLEEVRELGHEALDVIHDVVGRLGFTPEAQDLAKKSVALTLQALGNSPKLSSILKQLKKNEGKYISSHSHMLAEISCAIAHRIGMASEGIFHKLALSAFLHDLSLSDHRLAQFQTLAQFHEYAGSFTPSDLQDFRLHPIQAAEYSKKFREIPAEVETILIQHHERPDGQGFPRGLFHQQIHTLACVFIVAHDLLHFFFESVPAADQSTMIQIFVEETKDKYSEGTFRKICQSLATGSPVEISGGAGHPSED